MIQYIAQYQLAVIDCMDRSERELQLMGSI